MIPQEVLEFYKGKKCLVTGGTGMIGRQVVDILEKAGAAVWTVDLRASGRLKNFIGDLRDLRVCEQVTLDKTCVFHVAGLKGSVKATHERPADFYTPILMMNTNVLEACRVNKVPNVVYVSSIGAYAESADGTLWEGKGWDDFPMDFFPGMAKRAGEIQIQSYREQYGVHWSVVRPTNVYGPGDKIGPDSMVVTALIGRIMAGENPLVVWGDGSAVRDFTFSRDVAEGIVMACYYGTGNAVSGFVNLGTGVPFTVKELVETLQKIKPFEYKFNPSKPSGVKYRVMDTRQAEAIIHWKASTPLLDGLKETWEWYANDK